VEVIEKTGNVFLGCTARACRDAEKKNNFLYYGDHHLACETGHTMGTEDIESLLHAITLTDDEVAAGVKLIDTVYGLYHDFVDEMYDFATNNSYQELMQADVYSSHINRQDLCGTAPSAMAPGGYTAYAGGEAVR
jgi:hypothetical protein